MFFTRSDHFSDASQANVEAQVSLSAAFGRKALEGIKRFIDLQVAAVRISMQQTDDTVRELIGARDPQELLARTIMQTRPLSHKACAYGCHAVGIVASAHADFIELFSAQATAAGRETALLIAEVSKDAPPGMNRIADLVRTVLEHASAGCEHISLATRSVMGALESNLLSAANQFARAAEQTAAPRR